tara:strand:- start:364 stop:846 length:483 start_codon:yes stop_codon:yes gene_type:complete
MIPSFQMGLTDEDRSHLLDGIYDPSNNIGPRKNFPGDTFTQKKIYNFNQHFLDFSHRLIDMVSAVFGGDFGIGHMWGVVYKQGDEIFKHNHGDYSHAFVYYVKCCEKCSPIVFPHLEEKIVPELDKVLVWQNNSVSHHYVEPQQCEHDRVVLSGHIMRLQ